jgi:hypothetical protein
MAAARALPAPTAQLLPASDGMKRGGEGRCQLPSGKTIKADFPPS